MCLDRGLVLVSEGGNELGMNACCTGGWNAQSGMPRHGLEGMQERDEVGEKIKSMPLHCSLLQTDLSTMTISFLPWT